MRVVNICLMSFLLVPTLVSSMNPPTHPQGQQPHPQPPTLPAFLSENLPIPQPVGSVVSFVHEKNERHGVTSGWDHKGHYKIAPLVDRQGQAELLREVVVNAHPLDVHHTGHVHSGLGSAIAHHHQQNPPQFVIHPTESHPKSVNSQIAAHLAKGANGGYIPGGRGWS